MKRPARAYRELVWRQGPEAAMRLFSLLGSPVILACRPAEIGEAADALHEVRV
jgi:hypothetical protein